MNRSDSTPVKPFLSKSTFIRGLQCEKSLYLHKKRPFLRDRLSAEQLAKFTRGHRVGVYAQELFPGGIDLGAKSPFQMGAAIRRTADATAGQQDVIYEASFQHAGVRVALDILVRQGGDWEAVEVKSSRSVTDTYIWDASLQYFVIRGSGLSVRDFSIVTMNPDYVRRGPIDLQQLFVLESVLDRVKDNQALVQEKVERFREVSQLLRSPDIPVGPHCRDPYPCDFIGHCWKKHDENLPRSRADHPGLIDREALARLQRRLKEPAICFSSLSFAPAIPLFDGTSPYQKLGFSLGWTPVSGRVTEPRILQAAPYDLLPLEGIREMLHQLAFVSSILVYDKTLELEILRTLCRGEASLLSRLEESAVRMIDLQELFKPQLASPSGRSLHDSPEDILAFLGEVVERPVKPVTSRLEAALMYAGLAEKPGAPGEEEKLEMLANYHSVCLSNLRSLFYSLDKDHC